MSEENAVLEPVTPRTLAGRSIHDVMRETAQRRKEAQKLDKDVGNKVAIFEGGAQLRSAAPKAAPSHLIKVFEYVATELCETEPTAHHSATEQALNTQFAAHKRVLPDELAALKGRVSNAEQAAELEQLRREATSLAEERRALEERSAELQQRYAHLKESQSSDIARLKGELAEFSATQQSLEAELAHTKAQHASVEAQLAATQAQIATISQAAPRGHVALVFTDVQGSTTQWEMHADVMSAALALHNDLMRSKISEYGGYEVKTEGDAFMIAFESPLDAVRWCLDVQVALMDTDWPPALYQHADSAVEHAPDDRKVLLYRGLRVRMGVHYGEPRAERDPVTTRMDYFGPMVNRSARVEGATHGGQVVISQAVRDALGDDWLLLLGEPAQHCLGAFQLKGLDTPETLYELLPPTLALRTFKPPPVPPVPVSPPAADDVTLLSCDVAASDELFELYPLAMMPAVRLFKDAVEQQRIAHRGYLVRVQMDAHVLAFATPASAVRFACDLQSALLGVKWPAELAEHDAAALVERGADDNGGQGSQPLFCGLRARIAIVRGKLQQQTSGDEAVFYVGPALSTLSQLHSSASGGQCLATAAVWDKSVRSELKTVASRKLGELDDKTLVLELLPSSLKERASVFGKTKLVSLESQPKPPTGTVAIAVAMIASAATLWEQSPEAMRKTVHLWSRLVRKTSDDCGGYMCNSKGGRFAVAFGDAPSALHWAMQLQLALVSASWPDALNDMDATKPVRDANNEAQWLFKGPRAALAIEYGTVETTQDALSAGVTYIGDCMRHAVLAAKAAPGGQTLLGREVLRAVRASVDYRGVLPEDANAKGFAVDARLADVVVADVGRVMLQDQLASTRLYVHALPAALTARQFPPRRVVPPTGRVTLVMASIADYSDMLQAAPVAMGDALRIVNEILRDAALRYDGYEARSNSDMMMLAFGDATQAVRWTADVQRALLAADWPPEVLALASAKAEPPLFAGPRLSMAVHSGEPRYETHPMTNKLDFFGDVTTAVAAMEDLASGGQVLVSETAWKTVKGDLDLFGLVAENVPHKFHFAGIEKTSRLRQVLPRELSSRAFRQLGVEQSRRRVTGETLRQRVGALGTQNVALNSKLSQLEGELEQASSKVRLLSKQLRDVERGGADNPAELLSLAFGEVERVVETQDQLTSVITEVNTDNRSLLLQLGDLERALDKIETHSESEREQLQKKIAQLRKQLERMTSAESEQRLRAELAQATKELRKARADAEAAHAAAERLRSAAHELSGAATQQPARTLQVTQQLTERLADAAGLFGKSGSRVAEALVRQLRADMAAQQEEAPPLASAAKQAQKRLGKLEPAPKKDALQAAAVDARRAELALSVTASEQHAALADAHSLLMATVVAAVDKLAKLRSEIDRLREGQPVTTPRRDSADWTQALHNLEVEGSFKLTAEQAMSRKRFKKQRSLSAIDSTDDRRKRRHKKE